MGKKALVRIQNRSSTTVKVSVDNIRNVHDKGLSDIQGTLPAGDQLPVDGGYATIEGEPKLRIHKDGYFYLKAVEEDSGKETSMKLSVDRSHWWHTSFSDNEDAALVLSCDIDNDDDENDCVDIRIFSFIPTSSWMQHLKDDLRDTPLCRVAMPGTHDSATYKWNADLGASPDSDLTVTIQEKLDLLGKVGDFITDGILQQVFERLCQCQSRSIAEQLHAGIRYLDLRVAHHPETDAFYTCHGVYCVSMERVLQEIVDFMNEFPQEIVILDFNHLYGMEETHHTALAEQIVNALGDKIAVRGPELQPNSPVQNFWDAGAQAVVIYHDAETQKASEQKFWFKGCLKSPWPNKNDTSELHDSLAEKLKSTRDVNKFYVLQGILTPDGELIKEEILGGGGGSTSIKSIAARVSSKVVNWVEEDWKDHDHNIVIVDFVEDCCLIPAIINMNRKQQ